MESKPTRYKRKKPPGQKPQIPSQTSNKQVPHKWKKPEGSEQYSELFSKLIGRELECMVCMNQIGWRGKIWSCDQCRIPEHLTCIKKWKESSGNRWNCPACAFEYATEPKYTCFCGKIENPQPHPMIPPHSCGEVCGRNRGNDCPHLCPQQCHPGACPSCTSMAPLKACFCGKTNFQPLCKDRLIGRACEEVCGKKLSCGSHYCKLNCHDGECESCLVVQQIDCSCGKETLALPCGSAPICGQTCGKVLNCGKHFCPEKCHQGSCPSCKLTPNIIKRCPCGKNLLEMILLNPRSSCTDPVPSCYGVCDKELQCGHKCKSICHMGACPPCKATQEVPCRCTRTNQLIRCQEINTQVLCTKVCTSKKSCKKHKCNSICCQGLDDPYSDQHRCLEICGKMLKCGLHTCLSHCHIGNCEPCKVVNRNRIFCPCGKSFKDPPLRCGTSDMELECRFKCEKELKCHHTCQSLCHNSDCPPCSILVDKLCKCGKVALPVRCWVSAVDCGKICNKTLSCGHLCTEKCHDGSCESIKSPHLCKKKRENCEHHCLASCHHPGSCPATPCTVKVTKLCNCESRSIQTLCSDSNLPECNDECLIIKRDKALSVNKDQAKETYTEELVEFASSNLDFVRKVEAKFESILKTKSKTTFMPPMKEKQRWLCHELASNHYKLESESLDKEPYRSVYIHLTAAARLPRPLLSEFVQLVNSGAEVEFEKKEVMASLLFYQLAGSVTTDDLNDVLRKYTGEFFVKWENDHSAYAHFFSIHTCTEAQKTCKATPGQFSIVKMTVNTPQEDTAGFKKRFRNSKKPKEVKEFEEDELKNAGNVERLPKSLQDVKGNLQDRNFAKEDVNEERKKSIFQQFEDD